MLDTCNALSFISGLCVAVLELQRDITHTEVQDYNVLSRQNIFLLV